MVLPLDLVKLIQKYLNSNNFLLLTNLINFANNLLIESVTRDIITTLARNFNDIGFTNVVSFDNNYHAYVLTLNQVDYINHKQVIDFINILLDYIKPLDHIQHVANLEESMLMINALLYNYQFNQYLLIMYDIDSKVIYKWVVGKVIN